MKIKNLTDKMQELKLLDIIDNREITVYIEGNGVTEVVGAYVPYISKLRHIFSIVDNSISVAINPVEEISETPELSHEDTIETNLEDSPKDVADVLDSKFICDICGAEFASARGLSSHKNRSHAE